MKILIGGNALRELGSDRYTEDFDYLVNDTNTFKTFITSKGEDLINANGNSFFKEIFEKEKDNKIASIDSLLDLKIYSWVQHLQNMNFDKVRTTEYDLGFLILKNAKENLVTKYITKGEYEEFLKFKNEIISKYQK